MLRSYKTEKELYAFFGKSFKPVLRLDLPKLDDFRTENLSFAKLTQNDLTQLGGDNTRMRIILTEILHRKH